MRFVKRQLTCLVNDGIAIQDEVEETEMVLGRVMSVANEISGDLREIAWIRHKIESNVLRELKHDRTLWDGTRVMTDPKARKKWEGFLKELQAEELAKICLICEVYLTTANRASSESTSQSDNESSGTSQNSYRGRKRTSDDLEDSCT